MSVYQSAPAGIQKVADELATATKALYAETDHPLHKMGDQLFGPDTRETQALWGLVLTGAVSPIYGPDFASVISKVARGIWKDDEKLAELAEVSAQSSAPSEYTASLGVPEASVPVVDRLVNAFLGATALAVIEEVANKQQGAALAAALELLVEAFYRKPEEPADGQIR